MQMAQLLTLGPPVEAQLPALRSWQPQICNSHPDLKHKRCCLNEDIETLDQLVQQGSFVDRSLYYNVIKRCMERKDLVLGKRVHALTVKSGYESSTFLANHIIRMYASHCRLEEANDVFTKVAAPDAFMWCSIIKAHAENGQPKQAMDLYRHMRLSTVKPDNHIIPAVLKACANAADLDFGRQVHADILGSAVIPNVVVGSCLVDMYAKCGSLVEARRVFDTFPSKNVVTWTAMIAGYARQGFGQEALALYKNMQQDMRNEANHVTFMCLLQACASIGALSEGKQIHVQIREKGLDTNAVVGSCLVDMYAKCGSLEDARSVFDRLYRRDVVSWTAMIAGYVRNGMDQEALALYESMQQEGQTPANYVTFVCLLQACARLGALHSGKRLHSQIEAKRLDAHPVVGSSLVDMYARCGSLKEARNVFDKLPTRDAVTWTALLNGYAKHSDGQMAIQCFKQMQDDGVEPNDATFLCLLVACSHDGLVDEGQRYFRSMKEHGITPTAMHYNCLVDLLGRSGRLEEAETMLLSMPLEKDAVGWKSLLTACKCHGDMDRGRRCFDHLISLEPENAAAYVLMGNIYANAGRWADVYKIEGLRKTAGATKKAAKACIEVSNRVHEFTVGEERAEVSSKVRSMSARLKEGGHVPRTELVLKTVPDKAKEDELCGHAEKLALAYGLLNTPDGTTLLVTKNLRMCNDCHNATKIMSKVERREIILRDAHRVHHFTHGLCSCGDRH